MNIQTIMYLLGGTLAMIAVMLFCRKSYSLPLWQGLLSSVLLTLIGVVSVKLMFFFENGNFSGFSFFGAIFFIPIFAFPISLLIRMKYQDYLDIAAPSVAIMLAIMKIDCLVTGCCRGKIIFTADGVAVRFPSQIFEMVCAALIAVILVILIRKKLLFGKAFPFFMFLYGLTRFILNLFRETDDFWLGLAIGNIWAILAVVIGIVWLILIAKVFSKEKSGKN